VKGGDEFFYSLRQAQGPGKEFPYRSSVVFAEKATTTKERREDIAFKPWKIPPKWCDDAKGDNELEK
jgi:hypothetical protein